MQTPPTVLTVTCPAAVPLTVDAPDSGMRYVLTPASGQINVGGIARFSMHKDHNVIPSRTSAMTDPGLNVSFNETKCLMFTRTGTFKFECSPHGFVGTIVVQ
jgi:plastocyanin